MPRKPRAPAPPVDFENDSDDRLVTPDDVSRWLQISRSLLYELSQKKPPEGLPKPITFGRLKRWRLGTLRAWMLTRDKRAQRHVR